MLFKSKIYKRKQEPTEDKTRLSVSKIKTFSSCPAKFRFQYIEKLPKKDWEHLKFGKFLHAVLEYFEIERLQSSTDPNHIIMSRCFKQALKEYDLSKEQKTESWNILFSYLQKINEGENYKILAVEKPFYIDIDGTVMLNGFIDLVKIDDDGVLHVADYKTTKDKRYLKNDDLQLLTYAFVLYLEDPTVEKIRGSYIMLRHNFDSLEFEFTREDLVKVQDIFLDYTEKIKQEKLYRAKPTGLCKFCDFVDHCETGRLFLNKGIDFKSGFTNW